MAGNVTEISGKKGPKSDSRIPTASRPREVERSKAAPYIVPDRRPVRVNWEAVGVLVVLAAFWGFVAWAVMR